MSKKIDRCTMDLHTLPQVDSMDIFIRLDNDVDNILKEGCNFQEVYERAKAALMFICQANDKNEDWRNSALLRAGLNEFYSLEGAAKRDCKRNKIGVCPARIRDSKNPLVHIMYLLRHATVHAQISRTRVHSTSVISTLGGDAHEIELGAVILDAPTIEQVLYCSEAKKHYDIDELTRAAEWIDDVQYNFGIGEVFRSGVSIYCRELLQSVGYKISPDDAPHASSGDAHV